MPTTDRLTVRVRNARDETDVIRSCELHPLDGAALPVFEAGAHIDVHVDAQTVRQYSLVNDPADPSHYRIGVKREDGGRGGSRAVHAQLVDGTVISIGTPRNRFRLGDATKRPLFLAGGIGVTPLLSMAQSLFRQQQAFHFHYFARNKSDVAFADIVAAIGATETGLHLGLQPAAVSARLELLLSTLDFDQVYVCGPSAFLDAVNATAARLDLPSSDIVTEHFNAARQPIIEGAAFEVVLKRSAIGCTVGCNQSILEALRDCGIDVMTSCEQGVCGTCLTGVLDGVPDHRDYYLNDDEKEAGNIMAICVSRSKTKSLVLDL